MELKGTVHPRNENSASTPSVQTESQAKFCCPLNISGPGASQQNGDPAFPRTAEADGDLFESVKKQQQQKQQTNKQTIKVKMSDPTVHQVYFMTLDDLTDLKRCHLHL